MRVPTFPNKLLVRSHAIGNDALNAHHGKSPPVVIFGNVELLDEHIIHEIVAEPLGYFVELGWVPFPHHVPKIIKHNSGSIWPP